MKKRVANKGKYIENSILNSFKKGLEKSILLKNEENDIWDINYHDIESLSDKLEQNKRIKRKDINNDKNIVLRNKKKRPRDTTPLDKLDDEELFERIKESKLTMLQLLITISILQSPNSEASVESILEFVDKHQEYIAGKDSTPKTTDPKRAILASLSKNASTNPLFIKEDDENIWKIGPNNLFYGLDYVPKGLLNYISQAKANSDKVELTDLQKMIIKAITLENGKPCTLEKIYEYVKPRYEKLKRRDGSSYATNVKRALQASLSNNSSSRPIFQAVEGENDKSTLWTLTERGELFLNSLELEDFDL